IKIGTPPSPSSWNSISNLQGLLNDQWILVLKGEDFHQYNERFTAKPYGVISPFVIERTQRGDQAIGYYRLIVRKIGRSTDERTFISTLLPPGILCHESVQADVLPMKRLTVESLSWLGAFNSFSFDLVVRQIVAANLNLFIIEKLPL